MCIRDSTYSGLSRGGIISPDGTELYLIDPSDSTKLNVTPTGILPLATASTITVASAVATGLFAVPTPASGFHIVTRTLSDGNTALPTITGTGWTASISTSYTPGSDGLVTPAHEKNLESIESAVSASTLGAVTKKIEVFDSSGNSLGWIPVYDFIT